MGCLCANSTRLEVKDTPKRRVTYDALTISPSLYIQANQEQFSSVYSISKPLGKGVSSSVYQCYHKRSGQLRAVKLIHKSEVDQDLLDSGALLTEVEIHKALDHPNIVRLYEFFEDKSYYYFVQEYCSAGELFDMIIAKQKLSEKEAALIMEQLLATVSYLHSRNIIHRDIKPENILLQSDGVLKLIDFDAAILMDIKGKVTGSVGTAYYVAPEVLNGSYNEKCDVWSLGVVMYILLTGKPPFAGHSHKDIVKSVLRGSYSLEGPEWTNISAAAKDLIRKMLVRNPHRRISAQEAYLHPWITSEKSKMTPTDISTVVQSLKHFHATTKLRDALYTFICTHILASSQLTRLSSLFKACDTDGDGVISKEDLLPFFSLDLPPEEAEALVSRIMSQVDSDSSGCIDYTEFIKVNIDRKVLLSQENLQLAFSHFDKDGTGYITVEELKEWLANGMLEEDDRWAQIMTDAGLKGDGLIDLKVFERLICEGNRESVETADSSDV